MSIITCHGRIRKEVQLNVSLEVTDYNGPMFSFADKRPFNVSLVVIDTEPTGLLPQRGQRAVEIGAIRDEDGEEVGQIKALLVWIGCKEFTQPDQFG